MHPPWSRRAAALVPGAERERCRAGHASVFEVGRDVEVEMLDVHRPIRDVALRRRVDAGPDAGGVPAVQYPVPRSRRRHLTQWGQRGSRICARTNDSPKPDSSGTRAAAQECDDCHPQGTARWRRARHGGPGHVSARSCSRAGSHSRAGSRRGAAARAGIERERPNATRSIASVPGRVLVAGPPQLRVVRVHLPQGPRLEY